MPSTNPTQPDRASVHAAAAASTWPPLSTNRVAGIIWSEQLFAQARTASNDAARFAAGLGAA